MKKKVNTSFEHIAALWDTKTGDKGKKMVSAVKVTVKHTLVELGDLNGKKVYEIACGNGFLARILANNAKEVWASDPSESLVKFAKDKYDAKGIKYSVREATDFKGIKNNYFDAIIIHQGIFYIKDIEKLAKEIYKTLKPGGILVYTDMHPLMYVADLDTPLNPDLKELKNKYSLYLKNRKVLVHKKWVVDGKRSPVKYHQFKRPLSYYINIFAANGLPTVKIVEPPTITMLKDKNYKSPVPSSVIVKCQKI